MKPISTPPAAVRPLPSTSPTNGAAKNADAARKAGQEFEEVFLGQMIAHMFDGVGDDKLFGGGEAGKLYRSMMQDEYGKTIARSGGIGIADAVTRQVLKLQEKTRK